MFSLQGKVAVITGGAKGIGAAAVRNFLDEGAKFIAFIDVDESSGLKLEQDLLTDYGKDVVKFFKCDITRDEELFSVFNYIVKHYGIIDVVLNNAGIANDAIYKREIEINVTAVITSTLKALEIMRKDLGGPGGTIINVSSLAALDLQKEPTLYVYSATKSAVLMFGTNLGMEAYYSLTGVRIITMCFGLTSTNIIDGLKCIDDFSTTSLIRSIEGYKQQSPKDAAAGIVEAFKKGSSGSTWLVVGGEIKNITQRVVKGYQVMSGEVQI